MSTLLLVLVLFTLLRLAPSLAFPREVFVEKEKAPEQAF